MKELKKKTYEKPQMQVFELQHQTQLLAGSGGLDDPGDYEDGLDPFGGLLS